MDYLVPVELFKSINQKKADSVIIPPHTIWTLILGEACYSLADTAEGCNQDHGQTPGTLRLSQSSLLVLQYYA